MLRNLFRRKPDTRAYDLSAPAIPARFDNFKVFDNKEWLGASVKYVRSLREARANGTLIPEPYLVAARDLVNETVSVKGNATVLDYGGGIGPCVDPLTYQVPKGTVEYVVVDGEQNAATARGLFPDIGSFTTQIPPGFKADILLMSSALQYLANWRSDLGKALDCDPEHVVLSRLPVRDGATIAVRQRINLNGKFQGHVWHWIFGGDLDSLLSTRGYARQSEEPIRDLTEEMSPIDIGRAALCVRVYRKS